MRDSRRGRTLGPHQNDEPNHEDNDEESCGERPRGTPTCTTTLVSLFGPFARFVVVGVLGPGDVVRARTVVHIVLFNW